MTADREDSAWDIDDPVLTLAALRLLPGNASATIRLDLLRAARERLSPYCGDPGWPNAAADELVPWAREQEDAPAQPFTDRIVGPRGSRLVVAGPVQDAVFALRTLVRALFVESPGLPARDVRRLSGLVGAALDISAEVCRRASLDPFLVPAATGDIIIPEAEMLGRYVHAVSLGAADVGRISGAARALAALSRSPLRSVERRPWGWVVAAPELLVPDLCRAIADDFANRGRLHALEDRYRAAVWSSVVDSMARLGARELVPGHDDLAGTFRLEDDHAAHVTVDSTTLVWDDSRDRIMSCDSAAAALLERAMPSDVVLVIGQPLADPYFDTEGGETGPYALSMSAADLEVLARLPIADSLTLWRFARSAARARARGGVTRFSTLDEFELYRELGERHPADQGDHHVHLAVRPGTALPLRLLAAVDASTDSVLAPDRSGVIEVRHRFRGVALPVFAAPIGYPVLARVAKLPRTDIWFEAEPDGDGPFVAAILDSLAVFTSHAASVAPAQFDRLPGVVTIRISIRDLATAGREIGADPGQVADAALVVGVMSSSELELWVDPSFEALARGPDNEADRALLGILVETLGILSGDATARDPRGIVDDVLPIGPRRILAATSAESNPSIGPADVPRWRAVSGAERAEWQDELGRAVLGWGHEVGRLSDPSGTVSVLNRSVAFLFERLVRETRELEPRRAIGTLLERIEALYQAESLAHLNLVSFPLVFGEDAGETLALRSEIRAIPLAAVATRFLVELLAATPPTGSRRSGTLATDRLVALAATIIELGSASDEVHLGVFDGEVVIEPSGRIAIDRGSAEGSFLEAIQEWSEVQGAEIYRRAWAELGPDPAIDPRWQRIDEAWRQEYGYPLKDVALLANAAVLIADDRECSVVDIPRSEAVAEIARRREWTHAYTERLLASLTLGRRDDFNRPPEPYAPADTRPWRFDRRLSMVRRPFIELETDGVRRLLYGTRHLFRAIEHLEQLLWSGRLLATGSALRSVVASHVQERALQFNAAVAAKCEAAGFVVRQRVHKVGGAFIGEHGRDFGDIDVLALDRLGKQLYVMECKSMAAARTPWEAAAELHDFTKDNGFVAKHRRRVEWVAAHLGLVLSDSNEPPEGWSVHGVLVTDMPVPAAFRAEDPFVRVVSLSRLGAMLGR